VALKHYEVRGLKWVLLIYDIVLFSVACFVAWNLRYPAKPLSELAFEQPPMLSLLILIVSLYIFGCYELNPSVRFWTYLRKLAISIVTAFAIVISINYFFNWDRSNFFGRGLLLGSFLAYFIFSAGLRYILKIRISKHWNKLRSLFIFHEKPNDTLQKDLLSREVDNRAEIAVLEDNDETRERLKTLLYHNWSFIVVNTSQFSKATQKVLMRAKFDGIDIWDISYFYERFFFKLPIEWIHPEWFLTTSGFDIFTSIFSLRIKRLGDIALSSLLFLLTSPIMLVTYFLIKLESPGPAIFKQTRTGLKGKNFTIYKFRSMCLDAEASGARWAQKNDSRVTRIGKFIRLTRIDELPQLVNVLRGDMGFIGPRPERPEFNVELEKQIAFYSLRHLIRPGITGWAQVMYPYGASVEDAREKLQFDLYYIKNYSLLLDIRIILKTISVVIFGKGR
jgi:exopolysaccharide biosynthesis polyprenyl glycosylphosphotransferase